MRNNTRSITLHIQNEAPVYVSDEIACGGLLIPARAPGAPAATVTIDGSDFFVISAVTEPLSVRLTSADEPWSDLAFLKDADYTVKEIKFPLNKTTSLGNFGSALGAKSLMSRRSHCSLKLEIKRSKK